MKRKTSLKDIAAAVGVSTALVSYVLNNKKEGRIRKEIAEKIREMAGRLNYRPNQIAKSLKTSRTNTVGLIVADISNPFSSSLARIIEDEADSQGYTVIFGSSDERADRCSRLIETFLNRQVDGLIIFPPADFGKEVVELQKQQIPFVLIDRYFPGLDTNQVVLDNYTASLEAVEHLIVSGRRKIGMITYETRLVHINERERGYLAASKNAGLGIDEKCLRRVSMLNDRAEIRNAVKDLVTAGGVDALFFASNRIAAAALSYIDEARIAVPEALSLVSFDETELFDFFHPPVSFIRQPLAAMGREAFTLLLENITTNNKSRQVKLQAELVVRKSSQLI